ncbi:uncharacterized protein I206_104713 [Kwoniella pini CBS 10737]|uniref:Tyrosyl-DNA phosphodiesterase 1 n=1 Tax=Kwoniella pini CBS 10737 TaxID=1296096 RepID=A0A1B9I7J8_9TREE|nr:uncharacterized protein I206_02251 [Kwoniella pini CBS 10737]OCF51537.1 hypothetical protein I206_02251 [Kwoniella pini CBS 10737]
MDEDEVASILGESSLNLATSARPTVPQRGENRAFDRYFDESTRHHDPSEVDFQELRRAAWATWKINPPAALSGNTRENDNDDDELARVLALSVQEHFSRPTSRQPSVGIVDDEEDEDLKRAIAMSQEEARAPKRRKREETPEEERKMLAEAMAASLAETGSTSAVSSTNPTESSSLSTNEQSEVAKSATPMQETESVPTPGLRIGGQIIDRAQLERERRERQAARQAASTPASDTPTPNASSANTRPQAGPSRIAGMSSISSGPTAGPSTPRANSSPKHPLQSEGSFPSDAAGEYYPYGELRHVALTIAEPTTERTFSPKQVIGTHSQISLIIMSSFVIDDQWIMDKGILPPPEDVPTIVVRPHPKDKQEYNGKIQSYPNGEIWVYPKMINYHGSAHMKYFWIFYKTGRLRIVISTANMVDYDWAMIENTIFVQDFLPLPTPRPLRPDNDTHDFPLQFAQLFKHTRIHTALRSMLHTHPKASEINFKPDDDFAAMGKYDWSKVKVRLVLSIPGTYSGHDEIAKYGIARLGKVLSEEGWVPKSGEKLDVEYQGSSLGEFKIDWFDKFNSFLHGKTSRDLMNRPKPVEWPNIRILFPTLANVEQTILGKAGGGTMFCGKAFKEHIRHLFRDSRSKRGGVLMHTKMLVATFEPQENRLGVEKSTPMKSVKRKADEMKDDVGGWVYVGSHNFSIAAWGTVDVKKNPPTCTIKNYEIGIVFPLERGTARAIADKIAPYKRPAVRYTAGDVPWDQYAHRE